MGFKPAAAFRCNVVGCRCWMPARPAQLRAEGPTKQVPICPGQQRERTVRVEPVFGIWYLSEDCSPKPSTAGTSLKGFIRPARPSGAVLFGRRCLRRTSHLYRQLWELALIMPFSPFLSHTLQQLPSGKEYQFIHNSICLMGLFPRPLSYLCASRTSALSHL